MDTLFVVGCLPIEEVLEQAEKNHVEHIHLGANPSFVQRRLGKSCLCTVRQEVYGNFRL